VPCQDVSIAGKRAGLAGERTGLFYEFARILRELRPDWFVLENVPGLLTSNGGRDFAEILRVLMVECGYGVSWRVLDSQFFGVAQRRRRVYVVGSFGRPCPASILFECESSEGNFAKGGKARAAVAAPLTHGSGVTGNKPGRRREDDENLAYCLREDPGGIGQGHNTSYAITGNMRNRSQRPANYIAATLSAEYSEKAYRGDGSENIVPQAMSAKWSKGTSGPAGDEHHNLVAMPVTGHSGWRGEDRESYAIHEKRSCKRQQQQMEVDGAIHTANRDSSSPDAYGVREFAGLPEGLDSARYRALGNAVTVQVAEWIGRRLMDFIVPF
jgi:DNA (cytosine-5)-methyltransferase 1